MNKKLLVIVLLGLGIQSVFVHAGEMNSFKKLFFNSWIYNKFFAKYTIFSEERKKDVSVTTKTKLDLINKSIKWELEKYGESKPLFNIPLDLQDDEIKKLYDFTYKKSETSRDQYYSCYYSCFSDDTQARLYFGPYDYDWDYFEEYTKKYCPENYWDCVDDNEGWCLSCNHPKYNVRSNGDPKVQKKIRQLNYTKNYSALLRYCNYKKDKKGFEFDENPCPQIARLIADNNYKRHYYKRHYIDKD